MFFNLINRKSIWIKVNKTLKWHIEGEIIEKPIKEVFEQKQEIINSFGKGIFSLPNLIIIIGGLCIMIGILIRFMY